MPGTLAVRTRARLPHAAAQRMHACAPRVRLRVDTVCLAVFALLAQGPITGDDGRLHNTRRRGRGARDGRGRGGGRADAATRASGGSAPPESPVRRGRRCSSKPGAADSGSDGLLPGHLPSGDVSPAVALNEREQRSAQQELRCLERRRKRDAVGATTATSSASVNDDAATAPVPASTLSVAAQASTPLPKYQDPPLHPRPRTPNGRDYANTDFHLNWHIVHEEHQLSTATAKCLRHFDARERAAIAVKEAGRDPWAEGHTDVNLDFKWNDWREDDDPEFIFEASSDSDDGDDGMAAAPARAGLTEEDPIVLSP